MAFHTPLDAVRAATEVQKSLIDADWPAALLTYRLAAPVYAVHAGNDAECMPPFPLWTSVAEPAENDRAPNKEGQAKG